MFNTCLGIDATNGNLNVGLVTGYKAGSDNKEFGVNASARYTF